MKSIKVVKIIVINFLVVLSIILCVNISSLFIIKIHDLCKRLQSSEDKKELYSLPNFKNYGKKYVNELWKENQISIHNYIYKSFIEYKALPFLGKYITVNDEGYREHRQTIEVNKPTIRFFGGSTMFGVGVDDNNTIPALVDSLLNNIYNVYNNGVSANNSRHELEHLINFVNQSAELDIVVFYDGVNDIVNSCIYDGAINVTSNEEKIRRAIGVNFEGANSTRYTKKMFDVFFQYTITLIRKIKYGSDRTIYADNNVESNNKLYSDGDDYGEKVAMTLINNWKIAHDIVTGQGGTFIAVLQPEANIGNPQISHLNNCDGIVKNKKFDPRYLAFEKIYPIIKREMLKYDYMYDMSDAFDGNEYIYFDHCHVTSNGNLIIAKRMTEIIRKKIGKVEAATYRVL